MPNSIFKIFIGLSCLIGASTVFSKAQTTLPGGATSLKETHGNWSVQCRPNGADQDEPTPVICTLSQQLINPQSKQRVVAIELSFDKDEILNGLLLLPFGLRLSDGLELKVGDSEAGLKLPFSTCLPVGCLAPIKLEDSLVNSFKASAEFKVFMSSQNGQPIDVNISLEGFTSAYNRVKSLL